MAEEIRPFGPIGDMTYFNRFLIIDPFLFFN